MATQVSPKAGKHDAFITGQLGRAEKRIRLVDFAAGVAGLVAGTILFAVVVALNDRAFGLSAGTRQTLLAFYALGAAAYGYLAILRPMRWRVNPLYAARQIEQAMPGQRNHLVNWVDLRDEKLPGVIRSSLGQRAAKDLGDVDVDEAISNRRAWVAAGGVGVMGLVLIALMLAFGPRLFGSLLARVFGPFGRGSAISQTRIVLERPAGGDVVVTIGNPVTFVARIEGKVPAPRDRDAACLLYRAADSEPWRKRYMQDESGEWIATVGAIDVGNGFTYKLTAGDAETVEYRVTTRAAPLIADFLATYHFRPYVGRADRSRTERKLEQLRGTEVQILARTNRVLKDARLDFEAAGGGGDLVKAELKADDPKAMRFRFVLDRPGKYKLRFSSAEGETFIDPLGYDVVVLPDEVPVVRMTRPDKDIDAPAGGQIDVRGEVGDDIGIARVALRLKVVGGPALAAVPYLADRLGKAEFGTPRSLEYRELLELVNLRDEAGKPFEAKAGVVLECWLEARDACDFPKPNVGESKPKRLIRITPSKNDAAQKAEQEKAREEKKAADKKQEEDLKQQKADAEKRKEQDEADQKEAAKDREKQASKREDDKGKKPEEKTTKDKETEKKAEELKQEIENREKEKAEANEKAGGGKGPGEPKPGEGKEKGGPKEDKPGAGRDQGKKDEKSAPGEKKEQGKGESGEAKPEGKPEMNESKGEAKPGGESKSGDKPGEGKPDQSKPGKEGASKGPGKEEAGKPGEGKPEGTPDKKPAGEAKDSEAARKPEKGGDCPCEGKDGAGKAGTKGEAKPGGKGGEGKPGDKKGEQPGGAKGGPPNQGEAPGTARGGASPKNGPKPEDATARDAKARADDLSRGSEEDKQAAARDLKEIAGKAKDANARQAAQEGLAKARENFGKPAEPSDAKPEGATGDDVKRLAAKARNGDPKDRAAARGQLGEIAKQAKDADARKRAREALDQAWDEWVNAGQDRPRERERAVKSRPSAMQLEEFRKKVDPDILKDMKMSKEQFDQFLRDYADLADRTPASPEDDDQPAGVGKAPGTLPSLGGKTIQPGKGTNDPRGTGRAKPPPEYRDARDEFLRRLNLPR